MKKLFSLVLAISMTLVCLSAFAIGAGPGVQPSTPPTAEAPTMTVNTPEDSFTGAANSGDTHTQLWLQVDADMGGTIDVTVPLVLVFKTSIDGGEAGTGTNYGITNNSTADVAVTSIVTTLNDSDSGMTIQPYTTDLTVKGTVDQYAAKLAVTDTYDLSTLSYTEAAMNGGLFNLPKGGAKTNITAQMKTSPLSFVTKVDANGKVDTTKGVKILTVTYTVALNTANAATRGETIPTQSVAHIPTDDNIH